MTLEVIQRVIFGSRDPELRDALAHALDLTGSTANLIAMSLVPAIPPTGASWRSSASTRWCTRASTRAGRRRLDPRRARRLRRDPRGAARPARHAARRRPRDDRDRARLGARAPRPPPGSTSTRRAHRRVRQGDAAHPPRALDHRPQDAAALRARGYTLPQGVYVAPACTSPTAGGRPDPAADARSRTFIPFGGGTRRCLGAAFATLEMREVIRAVTPAIHARARSARGRADAPPQRRPRALRQARSSR